MVPGTLKRPLGRRLPRPEGRGLEQGHNPVCQRAKLDRNKKGAEEGALPANELWREHFLPAFPNYPNLSKRLRIFFVNRVSPFRPCPYPASPLSIPETALLVQDWNCMGL